MKKLTIMTLKNCEICLEYKKILQNENILYEDISCTERTNDNICNKIESVCKQNLYPISIIDNTIVVLTRDYSKLGKIHTNLGYNIVYNHSINSVLQIIKKILDL